MNEATGTSVVADTLKGKGGFRGHPRFRPVSLSSLRSFRWTATASAVALFAVLYLLPLGFRPLLLPSEFRYAEVPREMLASGDWIVPRLDGFLYFEKPALGYWLIAAAEAGLGENRFAARLPSALATGLTALLVAFAVRRAGGEGSGRTAALAALVYLSSLLTCVVGTLALLDAPLTLFFTGTLLSFFLASAARPSSGRERGLLLLSGAFCGLAFLTKGFLALVLPALVAACYLCWQKRVRDLVRMPWLPTVAAAAVAAPWSLAVHLRAPDFWRFFFWHEHVERFFDRLAAQHPQPWWLYLAATPLMLLPWTFFLPAAVKGRRGDDRPPVLMDLARFCVSWVVLTYLFFSCSNGKLLTYVLPAIPAFAILIAIGLSALEDAPRTFRRGGLAGALVFGLLAAGCAVLVLSGRAEPSLGPASGAWILAAAFVLVAVTLTFAATSRGSRAPLLAGWALVPLLLGLQVALPSQVLESKTPGAFLAARRAQVDPGDLLMADANAARAVCWIFERDDVVVVGYPGELRYGVEHDPSKARSLDLAGARRRIETRRGKVVLILTRSSYDEWRSELPPPDSEDYEGLRGVVFATYRKRPGA